MHPESFSDTWPPTKQHECVALILHRTCADCFSHIPLTLLEMYSQQHPGFQQTPRILVLKAHFCFFLFFLYWKFFKTCWIVILQQTADMMLVALLCEHRIEKEQHGIFSTEYFNEVREKKREEEKTHCPFTTLSC